MPFTIYPKNSDIYLCKGVPLSIDYEYTLLFHNNIEQYNVLSRYVFKTFNDQSYQRADKGTLRIAELADNLYECNYLIFRNTSHGSRCFYAFVTGVTYINDRTTEVSYVIDALQTYYFDFIMPPCFVEREHTLTDNVGEYVEDEHLETGDMICSNYQFRLASGVHESTAIEWYIMVRYAVNRNADHDEDVRYSVYYWDGTGDIPTTVDWFGDSCLNGVPQGWTYIVTPLIPNDIGNTAFHVESIIRGIVQMSGTIVDIILIPREVALDYALNSTSYSTVQAPAYHNWYVPQQTGFRFNSTNDRYVPKNKKLYTSPFSKIVLSNNQGESAEYKWEDFTRSDITDTTVRAHFAIFNCVSPNVAEHCIPMAYGGVADTVNEQGVTLSGFPTLTWSEDSFARWENTNGTRWGLSLVSTLLSGAFTVGRNIVAGNAAVSALEGMGNARLRRGNILGAESAFNRAEQARFASDVNVAYSGANAALNVGQLLAERTAAKATPDTLKGSPENYGLLMREARYGYSCYNMTVCGEVARSIDEYFTMFGYAINRIKVPNVMNAGVLTLRPEWNYIKTRGCIVKPNTSSSNHIGMNAEVVKAIQDIFDNGITFWSNPAHVGQYNLSNPAPN